MPGGEYVNTLPNTLPFETMIWRRYVAAELAAKQAIVGQLWDLPQEVIEAIARDTEMGLVQTVAMELLHGHIALEPHRDGSSR